LKEIYYVLLFILCFWFILTDLQVSVLIFAITNAILKQTAGWPKNQANAICDIYRYLSSVLQKICRKMNNLTHCHSFVLTIT